MKLVRLLGSVKVAVTLIVSLVVILTVSTLMESKYGIPFAQKNFYTAYWFDAFLALVWINIFCATLTRIPFKKKHIGFVITHIGILTLLIGSLISRIWGIEGQMTLFEGDMRDRILLSGYELAVQPSTGPAVTVELKPRSSKRSQPFALPQSPAGTQFSVGSVYESASEWMNVMEGPPQAPLNRAIHVSLSSERIGLNQTFWLIEHDPQNPHSAFTGLGPAEFRLETDASPTALVEIPTLLLTRKSDGASAALPLAEKFAGETPLPSLGLTLTRMRYLPQAKVKEGKLINMPNETPFNPAVEFTLRDGSGRTEEHTRFFLFPNFPSIKGGEAQNKFKLEVNLKVPLPEDLKGEKTPGLTFKISRAGQWTYQAVSSKETSGDQPFEAGKSYATGWMDMQFVAEKLYTHAIVERRVQPSTSKNAAFTTEIILEADGKRETKWVFPDFPVIFKHRDNSYVVSLKPVDSVVPFTLHLTDFRKTDYPGTNNPASFESDVILMDRAAGVTIEKKIYMNHPLVYKDYRVFQASYMQDPEMGEASVFSIAKNPGIALIYPGAALILVGVITLFYLHPFFNQRRR